MVAPVYLCTHVEDWPEGHTTFVVMNCEQFALTQHEPFVNRRTPSELGAGGVRSWSYALILIEPELPLMRFWFTLFGTYFVVFAT